AEAEDGSIIGKNLVSSPQIALGLGLNHEKDNQISEYQGLK
ncbi:hypothetical protein L915_12195, partial [Phytophthora nicotianae]